MKLDPITIEVIGAAMASIVEETGETLIRASHSTNIKERRDCSTALFNAAGETLCQAEHIPIHLGSFIGLAYWEERYADFERFVTRVVEVAGAVPALSCSVARGSCPCCRSYNPMDVIAA